MLSFMSRVSRFAAAGVLCVLAAGAFVPSPAQAYWVGGWGWRPGIVIAPPVVVAPPPVVYAPPPVVYAPPPHRVHWVPGHYDLRGYWIPGHWI